MNEERRRIATPYLRRKSATFRVHPCCSFAPTVVAHWVRIFPLGTSPSVSPHNACRSSRPKT